MDLTVAWPRGATPRPRSGAEAGKIPCPKGGSQEELPKSKVRGGDRECKPATVQERPRGATTSEEQRLQGCRRVERSYSMFKIRKGDLVQGKEQQLCFAGAAMKRYPTSKVRETQVRW